MKYLATTISDEEIDLGPAYNVQINRSKEAPADSLTAVFFSQKKHSEYKNLAVYTEKNQLFFSGIVDEQQFEVSESGCFLTIKSRSNTAYLIDNEASPQIYKRPSLDIIFRRHVEPYGFTSVIGDKSIFNVTLEVEKGMSEWDVFEQFCRLCLKEFPIVNPNGVIDVSGRSESDLILFSNKNDGVNYSAVNQKYSRYKLISEITVCAPYAAIYVDKIKDQELINKGISRRKFISMSEDTETSKAISVSTAEQMIYESKKKFNEIIIKCPGAVYAQLGNKCEINDYTLGSIKNLQIYEIDYILNQNGEFTTFTLLEG